MPASAFQAGGNISPAVFVKMSTASDNTVLQGAASGDFVFGISTPTQKLAPIPENTSTIAAASGDPVMVFGIGDITILTMGSGGVTRGDRICSDSSGQGVTAGSGALYGALALESAASGTLGRVQILLGKV